LACFFHFLSTQKKIGHRSITSTTMYENNDEVGKVEQYTIKAVSSKEEAVKLEELGFEPFDEIDGVKLYRRRLVDW
jgi:hypothetical protein